MVGSDIKHNVTFSSLLWILELETGMNLRRFLPRCSSDERETINIQNDRLQLIVTMILLGWQKYMFTQLASEFVFCFKDWEVAIVA